VALVLYSQFLSFPDGTPAANFSLSVYPRASNQPALIFIDSAGATPAPNPFTTDGNGFMSWYAAPDEHEVWIAGTPTRIPLDPSVTDPVWPGLFVHEQSTPAVAWTIHHCFGVSPAVDVVTAEGHTVAEVDHPDALNTVITFGSASSGTAYLRR
jgi:hypothetical protein